MVARWVQERTEVSIQIMRPPNYSATILVILLFAFVGVSLYVRYGLSLPHYGLDQQRIQTQVLGHSLLVHIAPLFAY